MKIYTFDAAALEDDALFDEYMKNVSPFRRRKIRSMKLRQGKNLSLGAGAAIDLGLRDYGLREKDMEYGRNQYGKPCFTGHPEIYFNVSHSGTMAIAVFSDRPVGCDIEKIREANLKIAERFFCREEYIYILSQPDRDFAFWRLWTLKESFVKAIGTGIGLPLDSFCMSLSGDKAEILQKTDEHDYSFFEYTAEDYRIAVCERIK